MALANFFNKTALGASQILENYDREVFEKTLLNHNIAVVFGENAISTHEGTTALDLIIRLTARLYPNLQLINKSGNIEFEKNLIKLIESINPKINLEKENKPTIYIVVGKTKFEVKDTPCFYIGSKEWISYFSTTKCQEFSSSLNPFGSSAAVCFGLSNVFRKVFEKQLPYGKIDNDFSFSVLDCKLEPDDDKLQFIEGEINLPKLVMVGAGAIGNSFLWTLRNYPLIAEGEIVLIDGEKIELSNLQRYLLATQKDIGKTKVKVAKEFIKGCKIKIDPIEKKWEEKVTEDNDWRNEIIVVCVDSAEDRMSIQASLPKKIFNAWTQTESIGISQHLNFLEDACLACLYLPEEKKMSRSEIIAYNLGIPENERIIRDYLAEDKLVDNTILELVSKAKGVDFNLLKSFSGLHLEVFHSEVVCGGVVMQTQVKDQSIVVPSAFESALAGILLAAEVIIETMQIQRSGKSNIKTINLLRPITKYTSQKALKHHSGNCICYDDDFRKVYEEKWFKK